MLSLFFNFGFGKSLTAGSLRAGSAMMRFVSNAHCLSGAGQKQLLSAAPAG